MSDIESKVDQLDNEVDRLQNSVGDRLESYDATMKDVKSDVSAMEDTFGEALPAFTENVSKMRELIEELKQSTSETVTNEKQESTGATGDEGEYETLSGAQDP